LLIVNHTSRKTDTETEALGLGLRVVSALLRQETDVQYLRRRGRDYYAARLQLPARESPDFVQA